MKIEHNRNEKKENSYQLIMLHRETVSRKLSVQVMNTVGIERCLSLVQKWEQWSIVLQVHNETLHESNSTFVIKIEIRF